MNVLIGVGVCPNWGPKMGGGGVEDFKCLN
jgi:hypothetical protein